MSDTEKTDRFGRAKGISATRIHEYHGVPTGEYDEDRTEKPWQRVPSTLIVVVLGVYLLLAYLTQLVEDDMPSIVKEASVARDNSETFSEEVALRYLSRIVGNEPRVSGTAHHLAMTEDLKAMVDEIAAQANQAVRTDWQIASGVYFHNSSASFYNMYDNASNIIALLEGESGFHQNGTIGSSILVNCHYDSVPFALGASDNAVFCAVMAESLNKLARRTTKLKRNIIFLFNGAEENGLQASHAFLQHPWAQGVTAVINLDAAGMNGKPTIFQVTDPRVLNAYSRVVPRPNAQGLAEFLFSSGIIPSDTDFRIWRDFGKFQGIDMAFVKWAHVYHTRNDKPELILPGVIQNAGDMMLALLTEVGTVDDLDTRESPSAAVYYDYLNVFLVTYSFAVAYVVDVFIVLFGLASVGYYVWIVGPRWSSVRKLLFAALGRVLCVLAGILAVAIFVPLMVATTIQMRYLSEAWIVVPLYWMPYLIAAVATAQAFDAWSLKKNGLSRSLRCVQAMAATRLLLSVSLLVLICIPALNSLRYLLSVPLFIMAATSLASLFLVRHVVLKGWQHLLLEVCLSLPSVMFVYSLALRMDAQMLPIMGRSSSDTPDYTVAMLNVGLALIVTSTVSGIELLFSRKRLWMVLSGVGAVCIILMFIPFNPYEDDGISLQRHYWFHTEIVSFDINNQTVSRSSGVVVTKLDPYSTERVVPSLSAAGHHVNAKTDISGDCEDKIYCGLPLFRTGFARYLRYAIFLYASPPAQFSPPVSATVRQRNCSQDQCSYVFDFVNLPTAARSLDLCLVNGNRLAPYYMGPKDTGELGVYRCTPLPLPFGEYRRDVSNHNMITLWARPNVTLSSWSVSSDPTVCFYHKERPVYVIYHSAATYTGPGVYMTLNVTFNVPSSLQSQPILDLTLHSHKMHHPEDFTTEYRNLIQAMPKYFNIASAISFRYDYVF